MEQKIFNGYIGKITQTGDLIVSQKIIKEDNSNKEHTKQRIIRTMKSDVTEAVSKQNETLVSIVLAEEKKREEEWVEQEKQVEKQKEEKIKIEVAQKENKIPIKRIVKYISIILGIVIIIFALINFYKITPNKIRTIFTNQVKNNEKKPRIVEQKKVLPPIILAQAIITPQSEKRFVINLNKTTPGYIFEQLKNDNTTIVKNGDIRNFYFYEDTIIPLGGTPISLSRLFSFYNINIPNSIVRSIESPYMIGVIGDGDVTITPFIILKTVDKVYSLASILEWEDSLPQVFDVLFGTKLIKTELSTTRVKFSDKIINGKDARIFTTESGGFLMYAFVNPQTIIISGSESAFEKLSFLLNNKKNKE